MSQDTQPAALHADGAHDAWAEFRVADGSERLRLLKSLCDGCVPVTLSAPHGVSVSTQLWSLDAAQDRLSFSAEADSVHMQRLAHGDEAVNQRRVTNLGTFGIESFTPVINPPQTCILGVCNITTKVREKDGKIAG